MYTVEARNVNRQPEWITLPGGTYTLSQAMDAGRFLRSHGCSARFVPVGKDVRRASRQSKRRAVSSFALLVANATETQRAKLQAARDAGLPFARLARLARLMGIDY